MEFVGFRVSHRTLSLVLAFGCYFGVTHATAQQAKPNLSGVWKLNLGKSKLAPRHSSGREFYEIHHSEPKLDAEHVFSGRSERDSYLIDGKEWVARRSAHDGELSAKAYWDGDILVIEKNQGSIIWTSRYSLSPDGKSLILTQHVTKSDFGGPFDESLVFDKQR